MQQIKRVVIVAGEASGDLHAASLVRELKAKHQNLYIAGIGSQHMKDAGAHLIDDLTQISGTGLSFLRHLHKFVQAFKNIKCYLRTNKPDLLVLVDFPEFNLRLAKYAKQVLGIRVLYYISPQIWAWKAGRIHTIRESVDQMALILPFEKKIYENAGIPAAFVGHPLAKEVHPCENVNEARAKLNLPTNKRIIAMLPGSRVNEIERHMPVLVKSAEMLCSTFDDLHFVIPVASTIAPELIKSYLKDKSLPYTLTYGKAVEAVACSDCVVVASGTASLECALLAKPMCIIYKSSRLTAAIAFKVIKVKYLGLCNLLKNKMTVPELLHYDCNPVELTRTIIELLTDSERSQRMQNELQQLKLSLSTEKADCTLPALVEKELLLR